MITDVQRIANVLKIKGDDQYLVLKIQDVIKAKESQYKKKDFCNAMLKAQNDRLQIEIHNLKNEFAESIGINEHMMLKNSRENLKKEYQKVLEENHKLRSSIEKYRAENLKDRLMNMVK